MKPLIYREDEAAWLAWTEGVRRSESCMALMRRIIDAVDALREREANGRVAPVETTGACPVEITYDNT